MTEEILNFLLQPPTYQSYLINQLTILRDAFVGELNNQLILNKILRQKPVKVEQCQQTNNVKISKNLTQSEQLPKAPPAPLANKRTLIGQKKRRRIWKNSVSHNSCLRNDTKNIPKNFGKAILNFIHKSSLSRRLAHKLQVNYSELMVNIRRSKKKINTIEGLRQMWGSDNVDNKITKCIRILSYEFMRKYGLQYIFRSRIRNYTAHIKYRNKMVEGIQNPVSFKHIKDF